MSKFIVVEGIDGVGKTTLVNNLLNYYKDNGKSAYGISLSTRDMLDKIVFEKNKSVSKIDYDKYIENTKEVDECLSFIKQENNGSCGKTCYSNLLLEAYLQLASTVSDIILQKLYEGSTIICDRWTLSTLAYNSMHENTYVSKLLKTNFVLNKNDVHNQNLLNYINRLLLPTISPDVLIYLNASDGNLNTFKERISKRKREVSVFEKDKFQLRVNNAYNDILNKYVNKKEEDIPVTIPYLKGLIKVDTTKNSIEQVFNKVIKKLEE